VVAGRPGGTGGEERDGAVAADRERRVSGPQLGEVLAEPGRPQAGGALVEAGEARDVGRTGWPPPRTGIT
jgi:hypothetical protein